MSDLKVNNRTYNYPDPGSEPGWGSEATDWAEAVTAVLDSLAGSGTIFETQAPILNSTLDTEVPGLIFNPSISKTNRIIYRVTRSTDDEAFQEHGVLDFNYNDETNVWEQGREITSGDYAKIEFEVQTNGQVIYTTEELLGLNYEGNIKFKSVSVLK